MATITPTTGREPAPTAQPDTGLRVTPAGQAYLALMRLGGRA